MKIRNLGLVTFGISLAAVTVAPKAAQADAPCNPTQSFTTQGCGLDGAPYTNNCMYWTCYDGSGFITCSY